MSSEWKKCSAELPPVGVVVMTKIDDALGVRNEQALKPLQRLPNTRSLWFFEDGIMYVYYEPTHWREIPQTDQPQIVHAKGA